MLAQLICRERRDLGAQLLDAGFGGPLAAAEAVDLRLRELEAGRDVALHLLNGPEILSAGMDAVESKLILLSCRQPSSCFPLH